MIRDAAGQCAGELVPYLEASAARSPTRVARRVARSIAVRRDRLPTVSIGGSASVGAGGAAAARLVWGSEQGPKSSPNHWGAPPSSGYWIAPAVAAFGRGRAVPIFKRALVVIFKRYRLL